jgi:hypothetical protein
MLHQALHRITPLEKFSGKKPDVSFLRIFGCLAYLHLQKSSKLQPKAKPLILVGYDDQSKAYRSLDPVRKRIVISRDIYFNESIVGIPVQKHFLSADDDILRIFLHNNSSHPTTSHSDGILPTHLSTASEPLSVPPTGFPEPSVPTPSLGPGSEPSLPSLPIRRSLRFRKQNVRLEDYILSVTPEDFDICVAEMSPDSISDNITFEEASRHSGWTQLMNEEIESIQKNQTWDLTALPPGRKTISAKWVFKTKPGIIGSAPRLKARLVACGFEQRHGIDFDEVFAPVVKWSTIRTLVARAVQLKHEIHHMDVKTTFLYGVLKDEVYMDQPLGYTVPGSEHLVCKLNKALYGLRQSPRMWYERISTFLKSIHMQQSTSDPNLIIVVYVDDLFITGADETKIAWLKKKLNMEFDMTDLGPIQRYLGVEFTRTPNGMFLFQHQYVLEMLSEFHMQNSKPEHVPLPPGILLLTDMNSPLVDPNEYCRIVGKLIFLTTTRPDMAYSISTVSRYMSCPQQPHMDAV